MVYQKLCCLVAGVLACSLTGCTFLEFEQEVVPKYSPREQVKIGCIVAEEYEAFTSQLSFMAEALETEGFPAYQADGETAQEVWENMCNSPQAEHMTFEAEQFYNMSMMTNDQMETAFLNNEEEELDLLLVFGTSAGVWLTQHAEEISFDYLPPF